MYNYKVKLISLSHIRISHWLYYTIIHYILHRARPLQNSAFRHMFKLIHRDQHNNILVKYYNAHIDIKVLGFSIYTHLS